MSEYWKSTPKYWCKHCKTYVRDSKLERTNHEATPKHQGNIKRFLRDLHRGHEKEERDQQRAKDEVNRLNGVVSSNPSGSGSSVPPWQRQTAIPQIPNASRQATPAERKQQLSQLASMGVAVPEDFRRELAMAGDWQTVSVKPVYGGVKKEEEDLQDTKTLKADGTSQGMSIGVRKRKYDGQEEEEEAGERVIKKGWGSTKRNYPGTDGDVDLDALLNGTVVKQKPLDGDDNGTPESRKETANNGRPNPVPSEETVSQIPLIKKEDSDPNLTPGNVVHNFEESEASSNKPEEELATGVVFKKRKPKQIRQK